MNDIDVFPIRFVSLIIFFIIIIQILALIKMNSQKPTIKTINLNIFDPIFFFMFFPFFDFLTQKIEKLSLSFFFPYYFA